MDPDRKAQIQMESKMKHLAATTGDTFRKIYDAVGIENPTIAARIDYPRIEATMRWRRNKTNPAQLVFRVTSTSVNSDNTVQSGIKNASK